MNVIHKNEASTVGIISDIDNLIPIGEFSVSILKEWMALAETVYDDDPNLMLVIKKSEDPRTPGYLLGLSKDGEAPYVCCTGKYRKDGKGWGEE